MDDEDWKEIYALRDEMESDTDRKLLRRLIKYAEYLELTMRKCAAQLSVANRNVKVEEVTHG